MALKGFDSMYEDDEPVKKTEPEPLPGTYEQLRRVWEKKKKNVVDKGLLINQEPVLNERTVLSPETVLNSETVLKQRIVKKQEKQPRRVSGLKLRTVGDVLANELPRIVDDSGSVTISENYMRFDMDIFKALAGMRLNERAVYLDLIRRSYGAYPQPRNTCECTNPEITDTTGLTGKDTITRAIRTLEDNGFISRWFKAQVKGQKSLYRVYLPCEMVGYSGRTKISVEKGRK